MVKRKKAKTSTTAQLQQPKNTSSSTVNRNHASNTFPPNLLNYNNNSLRKLNVTTLVPSAVFAPRNFMDPPKQPKEQIGFEPLNSPKTRICPRQCGRISRNDWDMAERLYQRMRPKVDEISKRVVVSTGPRSLMCQSLAMGI